MKARPGNDNLSVNASPPIDNDPRERFLQTLADSAADGRFIKLSLGNYRGEDATLLRISARPLVLRGVPQLSFVHRHRTRDVTKNLPIDEAVSAVGELMTQGFAHAHLQTSGEEVEWMLSRKGRQTVRVQKVGTEVTAPAAHDRAKHRYVEIDRPWLVDLGVTDAQHRLVPAMARKWKQIDKFVEVFDHALEASPLKDAKAVRVVDFGAGKGYLTFAVDDHLSHRRGVAATVTGVELRQDMVDLCNKAATRLHRDGLRFVHGDVRSHDAGPIDVMIALHACDTATDHAMHAGIRAGASIILCAPCCHKQLRPQMLLPALLRPMLQHGIHLGQEAEMLTDSLRALLLDAYGYDTQVFEFVALEHTSKNKMILAVKRAHAKDPAATLAQVRDIKHFFGVREQCLETLLLGRAAAAASP